MEERKGVIRKNKTNGRKNDDFVKAESSKCNDGEVLNNGGWKSKKTVPHIVSPNNITVHTISTPFSPPLIVDTCPTI